jgi:hypothetical protein
MRCIPECAQDLRRSDTVLSHQEFIVVGGQKIDGNPDSDECDADAEDNNRKELP